MAGQPRQEEGLPSAQGLHSHKAPAQPGFSTATGLLHGQGSAQPGFSTATGLLLSHYYAATGLLLGTRTVGVKLQHRPWSARPHTALGHSSGVAHATAHM